ncbi:MAG: hypothetical protein HY748_04010 [Elusimicrobia bacterium]|nr:hypothetical protein [Elusimicrobiota bacterium]
MNRRAHVVIPQELVVRIDALVGKRGRSRFIVDAASHELKRLRQLNALRTATGSWRSADHPELKDGSAKWVRALRSQDEGRHRGISGQGPAVPEGGSGR